MPALIDALISWTDGEPSVPSSFTTLYYIALIIRKSEVAMFYTVCSEGGV